MSNFRVEDLERIIEATGVVPALNQIELHPRLQQAELRRFHERHGIVTEAWSPLGQGQYLEEPALVGSPEAPAARPPRWCSAGTCSWATW